MLSVGRIPRGGAEAGRRMIAPRSTVAPRARENALHRRRSPSCERFKTDVSNGGS
jgi:hypothetical protein